MNPLKAFREQLGKLQRLAQPYFLPVEDGNGSSWQFLLLVLALLAVVVGLTLLLLTGVVAAAGALIPELRSRFLPGVPEQVAAIWSGPIGAGRDGAVRGRCWAASWPCGASCARGAGSPGCCLA